MHELSVTKNVLELASQHAGEDDIARVTDLYLVIGALSSIVDESVQFYWNFLVEGTVCEGSRLHFERLPAVFLCTDCNQKYELVNGLRACPICEGYRVQLVQGDEFLLESIEVVREETNGDLLHREKI